MNKYNHYYGIDISKDVSDVMDERGSHYQIENRSIGFKQVKKKIQERSCCVREATGVYQIPLAEFLYERGVFVSVVNLLVIKRFIQMNLRRIKTDKADAAMIWILPQFSICKTSTNKIALVCQQFVGFTKAGGGVDYGNLILKKIIDVEVFESFFPNQMILIQQMTDTRSGFTTFESCADDASI